jgi:glutamyl-Q tRNA(Asp) synthetase
MDTVLHRGRFAPSPTGPLHLGSLVAALGSWLVARQAGGEWLVRIEDLDPPREVPGAAELQLATLADFGLEADGPVLRQSTRGAAYASAIGQLLRQGDAFECACSRSELAAAGGIHRGCRSPASRTDRALRLRVPDRELAFDDLVQGRQAQHLGREVGDFVLRRADGLWAYQLAVVVDDAAQGITHVVRGADLMDSTPRQIFLQQCLRLPTPIHAHLPLVLDAHGGKLGKSEGSLAVDGKDPLPALRAAWRHLGQDPAIVAGPMALACWLRRAVEGFELRRIPRSCPGTPGTG